MEPIERHGVRAPETRGDGNECILTPEDLYILTRLPERSGSSDQIIPTTQCLSSTLCWPLWQPPRKFPVPLTPSHCSPRAPLTPTPGASPISRFSTVVPVQNHWRLSWRQEITSSSPSMSPSTLEARSWLLMRLTTPIRYFSMLSVTERTPSPVPTLTT